MRYLGTKDQTEEFATQADVSVKANSSNTVTTDTTQTISGTKTFTSTSNNFYGSGANLTGLNASNLASGVVPLAQTSAPVSNNLLRSNLGTPTVHETAIIQSEMVNRLQFHLPSSIETTANGSTWTTHPTPVDHSDIKNMVLGRGGGGNFRITYPEYAVRFTWTAATYVYLNQFYMYFSSSGHQLKVMIEKSVDGIAWTLHSDTNTAQGWPGHGFISHATIAWHPTPTSHFKYVRVTFVPTWSGDTTTYPNMNLYRVDWWGGYPAKDRDLFTYDFDKNFTFPAAINAVSLNPTNALPQSKTHASADTDSAPTAIHHTLGTGANQAAAGNHDHDNRYYTESEIDTALAGKSDTTHDHDNRYYTQAEVDALIATGPGSTPQSPFLLAGL